MLKNHLTLALRILNRFKGFALINLAGLSLGLAGGILIMMYVIDELSYDRFHSNRDRIYRVETSFHTEGAGDRGSSETNGWPVGNFLKKDFPEVESVLYSRSSNNLLINYNGKRFRENSFYMSPEFFSIFSFRLLEGNSATALTRPFTVVITKAMEKKFFHGEHALNKRIGSPLSLGMISTIFSLMKILQNNTIPKSNLEMCLHCSLALRSSSP